MRLFRAQRNFYISGFALFLSFVIRRLVTLISAQATLLAQSEASMKQAQSATTAAKNLLQKSGENAQNDSNEIHDKVVKELKSQLKDSEAKILQLENELIKEKKDKMAIKSQADSLTKEYDRLNEQHSKFVSAAGSGDKKKD